MIDPLDVRSEIENLLEQFHEYTSIKPTHSNTDNCVAKIKPALLALLDRARIDENDPNINNLKVPQKNHIKSTDYERGWNGCWDSFWTARWERVRELSAQNRASNGERKNQ